MEIIIFISETFVKQNSVIDENVDAALIRTAIMEAQDMHILPILGTGLYNEIRDQISASTLTALNTTLLETYISKSLLYWTLYEGADILNFKWRNKAIMKMNSDNAQPIETIDIVRLMDRMRDKAEWYSERITKYLIENSTSYPLYDNPGSGIDTIHPNRNNYTTGWYLGPDEDCCPGFYS